MQAPSSGCVQETEIGKTILGPLPQCLISGLILPYADPVKQLSESVMKMKLKPFIGQVRQLCLICLVTIGEDVAQSACPKGLKINDFLFGQTLHQDEITS